jgi:hypothetical protein
VFLSYLFHKSTLHCEGFTGEQNALAGIYIAIKQKPNGYYRFGGLLRNNKQAEAPFSYKL